MAKMVMPEKEDTRVDDNRVMKAEHDQYVNVIDAAAGGATNGLNLAVNIGAMLIAFVALIALINGVLGWFGGLIDYPSLTLQSIFGWVFRPESAVAGSLIGQKLVLNEFIAFIDFGEQKAMLGDHAQAVVSFALCGFANFSSIAIILGGLATIAPNRRSDVAQMGLRAVAAGFSANLMSAAIAGFYLSLM